VVAEGISMAIQGAALLVSRLEAWRRALAGDGEDVDRVTIQRKIDDAARGRKP
jgi:hypothetical protein